MNRYDSIHVTKDKKNIWILLKQSKLNALIKLFSY